MRSAGVQRQYTGTAGKDAGEEDVVLYGNYWPGTHRVAVSGSSGCIWADGTLGPDDNP